MHQPMLRGERNIYHVSWVFSLLAGGMSSDSLKRAFPRSLHLRYAKQSLSSSNLCSAPCEHRSEHHQRSRRFNSPLREKQSAPSHPRSTAAHSNRRNRKEVLTEDDGCTCRKRLHRAEHAKQTKKGLPDSNGLRVQVRKRQVSRRSQCDTQQIQSFGCRGQSRKQHTNPPS